MSKTRDIPDPAPSAAPPAEADLLDALAVARREAEALRAERDAVIRLCFLIDMDQRWCFVGNFGPVPYVSMVSACSDAEAVGVIRRAAGLPPDGRPAEDAGGDRVGPEAGRELARLVLESWADASLAERCPAESIPATDALRFAALRVLGRPIGGRDGGATPGKAPQSPAKPPETPPADPGESGPADRTTGLPGGLAGASRGPASPRPCPFCGGNSLQVHAFDAGCERLYRAVGCSCSAIGPCGETTALALAAWDRRKPDAAPGIEAALPGPCPWCGPGADTDLTREDGTDRLYRECLACGATGPKVATLDEALADAAWDRRAGAEAAPGIGPQAPGGPQ